MTQLKAFPVLVPPIAAQDAYVKFIARATTALQTLRNRYVLVDELFDSLVAQAFSG